MSPSTTAQFTRLESLHSMASDPSAVLASIKRFKNSLGGQLKAAFKGAQFEPNAHALISKRQPVAIQWRVNENDAAEELVLLESSTDIQNLRA